MTRSIEVGALDQAVERFKAALQRASGEPERRTKVVPKGMTLYIVARTERQYREVRR